MGHSKRTIAATAALLLVAASGGAAQIPEEFTNLQVLDENLTRSELVSVMRGFSGALGLRCNACHVGEDPSDFTGYDFASDDKDMKRVARGMMQMLALINDTHIPDAGRVDHTRVQCATCHRGVRIPKSLTEVVLQKVEEAGVDAAVATYRELRETYYGRAAYDFGQGSLNTAVETLARNDAPEDALAIIRLNIEHNPEAGYPNVLEAQILMMLDDRDGAIAAMERAIEIEPGNQFYKQQLQRIRGEGD